MLATRRDGVARVVGVELMIRDINRGGSNRDDAVATSEGVFDLCCSADSVHVQATTSDVRRRVRMATQYVLHTISGEHFDQPRTDAANGMREQHRSKLGAQLGRQPDHHTALWCTFSQLTERSAAS